MSLSCCSIFPSLKGYPIFLFIQDLRILHLLYSQKEFCRKLVHPTADPWLTLGLCQHSLRSLSWCHMSSLFLSVVPDEYNRGLCSVPCMAKEPIIVCDNEVMNMQHKNAVWEVQHLISLARLMVLADLVGLCTEQTQNIEKIKASCWWLSARLWYLHCISNGDTTVFALALGHNGSSVLQDCLTDALKP